jgi:hypothetical protein
MARVDPLDEITAWIRKNPERLGACAFEAAKAVMREGLNYQHAFERCFRAALSAGRSESAARRLVFRGFAAEAAKHAEPPPELEDVDG